mgnify:CR=1 FL=1
MLVFSIVFPMFEYHSKSELSCGWASTFFAVVPREQMIVLSLAQIAPSDRYPIRRQLRTMAMSTIVD